jgi:large subunit ribosomal protein L2
MALQKKNPRTPGSRGMIVLKRDDLTKSKPEKSLTKKLNKSTGRNNQGKITTRHKGGAVKKKYRVIDFKRNKIGVPATVKAIEYDPNRNVHIALLYYVDGEKRYILCPRNLKVGAKIESGPESEIAIGNALPLRDIPQGTIIHNIELTPGKGAQMVRTAGSSAQLSAKDGKFAVIKLPSGELRRVNIDGMATIGVLGNSDQKNTVTGKAGINRRRGKRPTVRGSAMNPVDHPHGGGEGRAPIGGIPKTYTGKRVGLKTRKNRKNSSKYIITNRKGVKVSAA